MNDEQLKKQLGANIVAYRKRSGLTLAKLAVQLNYSDIAISKWERGESMPDVPTLVQLAELFETSVDALLADPNALPENVGVIEQVMDKAVQKTLKRKANKRVILGLCSLLVWFVSTLTFVVLFSLQIPNAWMAFFYAIPVDAIVQLSLRSAWKDFRRNQMLVSIIMWGFVLSLYMSLLVFAQLNIWTLFLLGVPSQAAIFLWFRMYRKPRKEDNNG